MGLSIVILGPSHPLRGGIAAFSERMALELIREGHDVRIETFSLQYPSFLFPGKTQYTDDPAPESLEISETINSIHPLNWRSVGRRIKKEAPDLIICKFWMPFMGMSLGTIARVIKSNGKTQVLAVVHNLIPHERRAGDRLLTKYFIGSVDRFVALSKSVCNDIQGLAHDQPIQFLPHPIYDHFGEKISRTAALEQLNLDAESRYLLFFGLIRDYKGLDLLIQAMADDRIQSKPIKLIIAGEVYGEEQPYRDMMRDLGVKDQIVDKMYFIPHDDVKYLFGAVDLLIQPYRKATQSGISQIAYHFDLPMIVTSVGGLPEIVPDGQCGYVVEPTSGGLADAIIQYYDHGPADNFAKGILEMKKSLGWSSFAQKMINPIIK